MTSGSFQCEALDWYFDGGVGIIGCAFYTAGKQPSDDERSGSEQ